MGERFLNVLFRSNYPYLLIIYIAIGLILYWNTFDSRVVFDHADYVYRYKNIEWYRLDYPIQHSTVTALFVTDILYFIMLKLISYDSIWNGMIAVTSHAVLAYLLVILADKISNQLEQNKIFYAGVFASICFLISPYASEVVVWGCTIYFSWIGILLLQSTLILIRDIKNPKSNSCLGFMILYALALFTHELSFFFLPFYFSIYYLISAQKFFPSIRSFVYRYYSLGLMFVFCLATRYLKHGTIIGHYGADTHLNFPIREMTTHFVQYIGKFMFFSSSSSGLSFINPWIKAHSFFSLAIIVIIGIAIWFYLRIQINWKLVAILLTGYFCLIFPVLNLTYYDFIPIEGDRHGYVASLFFYFFIAYILLHLLPKRSFIICFLAWIFWAGFILNGYNQNWHQADKIMSSIERQDYGQNNHYFMINMPGCYHGAYMYKGGYGANPLQKRIKIQTNIDQNVFQEIYSINLLGQHDDLKISKISKKEFHIAIDTMAGNWFWRGDMGASDYTTKFYQADVDEYNSSYRIHFDSIPPQSYLLYFDQNRMHRIPIYD